MARPKTFQFSPVLPTVVSASVHEGSLRFLCMKGERNKYLQPKFRSTFGRAHRNLANEKVLEAPKCKPVNESGFLTNGAKWCQSLHRKSALLKHGAERGGRKPAQVRSIHDAGVRKSPMPPKQLRDDAIVTDVRDRGEYQASGL